MSEEELENIEEEKEGDPVTNTDIGEELSIDNATDADDDMDIDLSDKYDE